MAGSPKPTLADVAARAGVSAATASRVLNGTARVSSPVRRNVEHAVEDLAYVRRRAARGRGDRCRTIAAVVCEDNAKLFAEPFFSRVLWGAGEVLAGGEFQLALLIVRSVAEYSRVERFVRAGHAGGVMLIGVHGRDPLATALQSCGVPVVFAGRPLFAGDAPDAVYVDADNLGGAGAATRHLLSSGRRRLATIAGPQDMAVGVDRLTGFRDAVVGFGGSGLVGYGDFSQASGEHARIRLLERRPDLDAVFAASDLMAAGALRALRRAGRRVPDDVAVVGFDDGPTAQYTDPRLTTVRQPIEEMGATVVRILTQLMSGECRVAPNTCLPTELILRESA